MKTKTTAILLLMGTVALGVAQSTQPETAGNMTLMARTANSITLQVTAGSQGTPYGFLVNWSQQTLGKHNVVFDGVGCPEFSLPPFGSTVVTIDGVSGSSCIINESPHILNCSSIIKFIGRVVGLGTPINGFADHTDTCL